MEKISVAFPNTPLNITIAYRKKRRRAESELNHSDVSIVMLSFVVIFVNPFIIS